MSELVGNISSVLKTDRAGLRWLTPLRSALVCALAVALAVLFGEASHTTPLVLGALFAGLADPRGTVGMRLRSLVIVTLMNATAGALGALVADSYALHLAAAAVVSLVCGYIGVIGPRAATAGMLALVTFIVFSGTVYGPSDAPLVALLLVAGSLLMATFSFLPALARRLGPPRADIAIAYRALGLTFGEGYPTTGSASLAAKVALARELIRESAVQGETGKWLEDLVETCERVRLGTFLLEQSGTDFDSRTSDFLRRFDRAAGALAFSIGSTLELPFLRSRLSPRLEAVESEIESAPELPDSVREPVEAIAAELRHATTLLTGKKWPIGRQYGVRISLSAPHEDVTRLWKADDTTPLFARHAVRISVVITLATALTGVDGFEHSYWLPMTVAWVMKPDLAGSATRLAARLTGTLAGALAFVVLAESLGSGAVATAAIVGFSAFFVFAFVQANYAVCTAGATALILQLVVFAGNPVISSAASRVALTVLAGLVILLAVLVLPTRSFPLALRRLARAARALADYVEGVRAGVSGEDLVSLRAAAALGAVGAGDLIIAVGREPGADRRATGRAEAALHDLVSATAVASIREVAPNRPDLPELTDRGLAGMRFFASRAEELASDAERGIAPERLPKPEGSRAANRFEAVVDEGRATLEKVAPG